MALGRLELDAPSSSFNSCTDHETELVMMLEDTYDNILPIHAAETQSNMKELLHRFRSKALETGKTPLVVSLDPILIDPKDADYTFQETRASLIGAGHEVIDIENNPRGYTNRFVSLTDEPRNGASKTPSAQWQEFMNLVKACKTTPIALAIVEDYVNTGRSIMSRFGALVECPAIEATLFSGLVHPIAREQLEAKMEVVALTELSSERKVRHMDMSDLLPTLGGRAIALAAQIDTVQLPYTVEADGYRIPVAVDATVGNYPWQADLFRSETSPSFLRELGTFSLAASMDFWKSLETTVGRELTWRDTHRLSGHIKTYYPAKDLSPALPDGAPENGPYKTLVRVSGEYHGT